MRLGGCPGGTSWAGWGFDTVQVGDDFIRRHTVAEANAALPDALRTNAVFSHFPVEMFQPDIPPATVNAILAKGVPALSAAAGVRLINNPYVYGNGKEADFIFTDGRRRCFCPRRI